MCEFEKTTTKKLLHCFSLVEPGETSQVSVPSLGAHWAPGLLLRRLYSRFLLREFKGHTCAVGEPLCPRQKLGKPLQVHNYTVLSAFLYCKYLNLYITPQPLTHIPRDTVSMVVVMGGPCSTFSMFPDTGTLALSAKDTLYSISGSRPSGATNKFVTLRLSIS